ncbi:MAG: GspH/FimT family pseudopilin [Burkholderiales bacterium]|nr:GspH/FimT family pseudopilin [Burkholderiales bacterium]
MSARGLTLIEVMMALAVLALVATLALPSFAAMGERARLKSVAETLAADLAQARLEAARRGLPLHVEFDSRPDWCWGVATRSGCSCGEPQPCQLKTEHAADHAGIELVDARNAHLEPAGFALQGGGAEFRAPHDERLRVVLAALGPAHICAPRAPVTGYPAC